MRMFNSYEPDQVVKELSKKTLLLAAVPATYALLNGEFASLRGFGLGVLLSLLLFKLRAIHLKKAVQKNPSKANSYVRNRYFLNYFIYFIVLFLARRNPDINFVAAALGLLFLKFIIIGLAVKEIFYQKWEKKMDSLQ